MRFCRVPRISAGRPFTCGFRIKSDGMEPRGAPLAEDNPMNQSSCRETCDNCSRQCAAMDHVQVEDQLKRIRSATRCGARTRAGGQCQCPAIRGRARCRIHGGLSPGAPRGKGNGNFKDGYFTREAVNERKWVKDLIDSYAKERDK
jgi:hypothetical protein